MPSRIFPMEIITSLRQKAKRLSKSIVPLQDGTRLLMKTYRKDQAWKKQSDWELPVGSHGDIYETSVKEGSRMVNRYLLCLGDRIIKLDLSFIPDARQQAVITETLQAL